MTTNMKRKVNACISFEKIVRLKLTWKALKARKVKYSRLLWTSKSNRMRQKE